MNKRVFIFSVLVVVLGASCATEKPKETPERIGAQVFRLSQEGGFRDETLELKEGRFRYWFSSDVIVPNAPKYPMEGSYECKGDQLILSSGKTYTIRSLKEINSLWRPTPIISDFLESASTWHSRFRIKPAAKSWWAKS